MGWGFRKRVQLLPGVTLNFSKKGVSTTIGPKGASVNIGPGGVKRNLGIPGTGLYSRAAIGTGGARRHEGGAKVRVGAQVDSEFADAIEAYASNHGISRPEAVRRLLQKGLEHD